MIESESPVQDNKLSAPPPLRLGFTRDEIRAHLRAKAIERVAAFRTLDADELGALVEYYILRWDQSFGRFDARKSDDVKETEHCLASLVTLEMRCNELNREDLARLRFGENLPGGIIIHEVGQSSADECDFAKGAESSDFTIGYLSEGFRDMFSSSSAKRAAAFVELTDLELEGLIRCHILLAERYNGLVDIGMADFMDDVAESYMSLLALEKEARRRFASRREKGGSSDPLPGFAELAREVAAMKRGASEDFLASIEKLFPEE